MIGICVKNVEIASNKNQYYGYIIETNTQKIKQNSVHTVQRNFVQTID